MAFVAPKRSLARRCDASPRLTPRGKTIDHLRFGAASCSIQPGAKFIMTGKDAGR
jgi:hypothetical protein